MMSREYMADHPEVDWKVYQKQQTPISQESKVKAMPTENEEDQSHQDIPLGKQKEKKSNKTLIETLKSSLLPKMPPGINMATGMMSMAMPGASGEIVADLPQSIRGTKTTTPEWLSQEIGKFLPGFETGGGLAKKSVPEAIHYMQPGKQAEAFRSTLGKGTTKENIETIGNRVQFAKKSAEEEAFIPKRELYSQEGKSDVYNVKSENLPEGNLPKVREMIEPGGQFNKSQMDELSRALKEYRKNGKIESFFDRSEEIFNIPELPEKAATKIEDALLMPTSRKSKYFADEDVALYYGKKGKIKALHDTYEEKPTLSNYDKLQSDIKKEQRKLQSRYDAGTITDAGEEKLTQLNENIKNLNHDKENFMQTLPDNMKNLENEFRQKYAKGVGKYTDAGQGAKNIIRKLYKGKSSEVTSAQITKIFTNPTQQTLDILKDLGPEAGRNILYNALQKVPVGDAEGMAKTILDLKRTKGFDQFIDQDMEKWANNMLSHARNVGHIKKFLTHSATAAGGSFLFGPVGGAIGAVAPSIFKGTKAGAKFLASKLKK